jgi:hypothetical protein
MIVQSCFLFRYKGIIRVSETGNIKGKKPDKRSADKE